MWKFHPSRKRLRCAQLEDVDNALYRWYRNGVSANMEMSSQILTEKAKEIATQRGHIGFICKFSWLDRWKKRHGVEVEKW